MILHCRYFLLCSLFGLEKCQIISLVWQSGEARQGRINCIRLVWWSECTIFRNTIFIYFFSLLSLNWTSKVLDSTLEASVFRWLTNFDCLHGFTMTACLFLLGRGWIYMQKEKNKECFLLQEHWFCLDVCEITWMSS